MRISAAVLCAFAAGAFAQSSEVAALGSAVASLTSEAPQLASKLAGATTLESDIPNNPFPSSFPTGAAAQSSVFALASEGLSYLSAEAATATGAAGTSLKQQLTTIHQALSSLEAVAGTTGQNTMATSTQASQAAGSSSSGNLAPATAVPIALGGLGMAVLAML